jgi:hypothetical protein
MPLVDLRGLGYLQRQGGLSSRDMAEKWHTIEFACALALPYYSSLISTAASSH